ncbi:ABC transporter ATP-binding protein [Rhodobacter xanthinilyticus]|uniref:ABC transporter ATP-binding protein n=1 Tax=Rhodobacter xanthinilyticus TaxID=1850250 RepID=A0A1D9MGB8_9RHOB|nr:ABC transporter ATP-binding protein [Rhodobacter xanthinilyticus]
MEPPAPSPGAPAPAAALEVRGLSHDWGARRALDEVSFRLAPGRFCALLGPNGAGKSTLIAVLTGLIRPRPGQVIIGGADLGRAARAARAQIGVVYQSPTYDPERSVAANLRYFAALHGLGGARAESRITEALARLGMAERAGEKAGALNGGHRRRMEIARALIHAPRLLILDEPTVGLDAPARAAITEHVHALCQTGVAVLWATHLVDEIRPEDDLLLLHRGRLAARGPVAEATGGAPLAAWFLEQTKEPAPKEPTR